MARDDDRYGRRDDEWRGRTEDDDRWRRERGSSEEWRGGQADYERERYGQGDYGRDRPGGQSYGQGGYGGSDPYRQGGSYGGPYGTGAPYGSQYGARGAQYDEFQGQREWSQRSAQPDYPRGESGGGMGRSNPGTFGREGASQWERGGYGAGGGGGSYGGMGGGDYGSTGTRGSQGSGSYGGGAYGTRGAGGGYGGEFGMGLGGGNYPTASPNAYEPWRSEGRSFEGGQGWQNRGDDWGGSQGRRNAFERSGQTQFGGFGSGGMGFGAGTERGSGYTGYGGVGYGGTGFGGSAAGVGGLSGSGSFYGRGPRGYQRSDDRIREDINDRLTFDPEIDASDVIVEVRQCEVTLTGTVDSRDQKRRAEDLAESVPGVRDVTNHLKVNKHHDREREHWAAAGTTGSSMTSIGTRSSAPIGTPSGIGVVGGTGMAGGTQLQSQVRTGMEVCDVEGNRLGDVKDMRGSDFLLDRPMRRDLFVPFTAVREVSGNRVVLRFRDHEIGDQNWESPALLGGDQGER